MAPSATTPCTPSGSSPTSSQDAGVAVAVVLDSLVPGGQRRDRIAAAAPVRGDRHRRTPWASPKKQLARTSSALARHTSTAALGLRCRRTLRSSVGGTSCGKASRHQPPPAWTPRASVAALVLQGGTTGLLRKGVLYAPEPGRQRDAVAGVDSSIPKTGGRRSSVRASAFFHCYGMTVCMNLGVLMAAKLVLLPRFELKQVMKEIEHERPSLFPGVPRRCILIDDAAKDGGYDSRRSGIAYRGPVPSPKAASRPKRQFRRTHRRSGGWGYGHHRRRHPS